MANAKDKCTLFKASVIKPQLSLWINIHISAALYHQKVKL